MTDFTLYHNPRCSKCKPALQSLRYRGSEPTVVEYLKQPLGEEQIKRLLKMLGMTPQKLLRNKGDGVHALMLDDPDLSPVVLIKAMSDHPNLIERPVAVLGEKAMLDRLPERVLDILFET